MFYLNATANSPKVIIDFPQLLFEMSGPSRAADPEAFYAAIFQYIDANFYEVSQSILQREVPRLTLHFYLSELGAGDLAMISQLDSQFHGIGEFTTYNYWYYNPGNEAMAALAHELQKTLLNPTRLIENSRV